MGDCYRRFIAESVWSNRGKYGGLGNERGIEVSLIEVGGLAGALVAIVTLMSKLVCLIAAIQKLISRIEQMTVDIVKGEKEREILAENVQSQGQQLKAVERMFSELRRELRELKDSVKELLQHVF